MSFQTIKSTYECALKNERHDTVAETRYWCGQYKLMAKWAIEELERKAIAEAEKQEPKCVVIVEVFGKDWRLEYMSLPVGRHKLYDQQYLYTHTDLDAICQDLQEMTYTQAMRIAELEAKLAEAEKHSATHGEPVAVKRQLVKIHDALCNHLGDTDPYIPEDMTDDEVCEYEPVFWAAKEIAALIGDAPWSDYTHPQPKREPEAWTPRIERHYKDGVLISQTIQYNPQGEKLPYQHEPKREPIACVIDGKLMAYKNGPLPDNCLLYDQAL